MAKDYEGSLGGEKTLEGQPIPKTDDLETRSLGDQATFAGGRSPQRDQSLGDQMTFGAGSAGDEVVDDGMEVVDLSARYKVEKTLGKGGMGEVLLATDMRLERKVAIKRILGEAARSRTAINRFLTEAKSIAALNHPNIVQIYDYGRATDGPFLIMEFVDGESLLDRTRAGALSLEEAVELTCQLCDGLAKAHDAGIIHRDIKPANVLLSKDGIPKLTDFGLAKAETADTGMTMAGAVLGTLDFMPPEQRRDAALTDARSDLWSLAATLYQLVTGKSPKIIKFNDIPKALQEVLGKALEDSKDDRYQSAREFKEALQQALVVPCLSCKSKMSMWEQVCGKCGLQQSKLLDQRKQEMAAERALAEQLLGEFKFAKAAALARKLGEESDFRLGQQRRWSEKFLKELESAEREQLGPVVELVSEGLRHEQAADYPAALKAFGRIPRGLLNSKVGGSDETLAEMLERVESKQAECKRLEKLIKERIESRQLNGLLAEVDKLLRLRPGKSDAQKLKKQLVEREARLRQTRDEAFAAASRLASRHDYEAALRELARIDGGVIEPLQQQLRERCGELAELRRQAIEGLQRGLTDSQFQPALSGAAGYRDRIAGLDNADVEFDQLLQQCQTGREGQERAEKQRKQFIKKAVLGSVAAAVLLLLVTMSYSSIRSSMRTAAVQRALSEGDHEEVLKLDPGNSEGLALKIKADSISKALNKGDFGEALRIDPNNREALALKGKVESDDTQKAEALSRALAAKDHEGVFRLDPSKVPAEAILKFPTIQNSIGLELKLVPAGTFTMGDSTGNEDETSHPVTLSRPFYLGVYEVTQDQYERVMGENPSVFKGFRNPVESVSWGKASAFCRKLSEMPAEKAARRVYRLPTEAEWEYACRAGSKAKYCFGDDESQLGEWAWYEQNSGNKTHPVGEKQPNAWGLYDMHGNVWEHCADFYEDFSKEAITDPSGPIPSFGGTPLGWVRVYRGGSWYSNARISKSAYRGCGPSKLNSGVDPNTGKELFSPNADFGFRVALSVPDVSK